MKQTYTRTLAACYTGYVVQAVVNNFAPLLFLTFHNTYNISMGRITTLITVNFLLQLLIDSFSAGLIDRIGYRTSLLIAHAAAALGFLCLPVLPEVMPDPYIGLLLSVVIYAVGGGLLEVMLSPVVEALPTKNKEKTMSLLHSFYCWGHDLKRRAVHHRLLHDLPVPGSGVKSCRLRSLRLLRGDHVAGSIQHRRCRPQRRRNAHVRALRTCRRPGLLRRTDACGLYR